MKMNQYEEGRIAVIIAVDFNETYTYQDIRTIGISDCKDRTMSLEWDDILRLVEDYEPNEVKISEDRSEYDDVIICVQYGKNQYTHYYCQFVEGRR